MKHSTKSSREDNLKSSLGQTNNEMGSMQFVSWGIKQEHWAQRTSMQVLNSGNKKGGGIQMRENDQQQKQGGWAQEPNQRYMLEQPGALSDPEPQV